MDFEVYLDDTVFSRTFSHSILFYSKLLMFVPIMALGPSLFLFSGEQHSAVGVGGTSLHVSSPVFRLGFLLLWCTPQLVTAQR